MTRGEVAYKGFERWRNAWCMTGSDRLRMKKPLKNHEAHSWKKRGKPFTDQTEATPTTIGLIGKGFFPFFSMNELHGFLGFFSSWAGQNQSCITHYVIFQSLYKPPHHVSFLVEFCITDPEEGLSIRPKRRKIDWVFKLVHWESLGKALRLRTFIGCCTIVSVLHIIISTRRELAARNKVVQQQLHSVPLATPLFCVWPLSVLMLGCKGFFVCRKIIYLPFSASSSSLIALALSAASRCPHVSGSSLNFSLTVIISLREAP